jgi:hypothetical protein
MSGCTHDITERDVAATADGLCPLCMRAENERLRELVRRLILAAEAGAIAWMPVVDEARAALDEPTPGRKTG